MMRILCLAAVLSGLILFAGCGRQSGAEAKLPAAVETAARERGRAIVGQAFGLLILLRVQSNINNPIEAGQRLH
jgi:hypothetical protein